MEEDEPALTNCLLHHADVLDPSPDCYLNSECYLNYPSPEEMAYPLNYELLRQQQQQDVTLQADMQKRPQVFTVQPFDGVDLICYHTPQKQWRIALPTAMLEHIVIWYHRVLNHCGMTRLYDSIATHLYHPQLKKIVEQVVPQCGVCRKYKLPGPGYGHVPPRIASGTPWYEVQVDLIGPWKVTVQGIEVEFSALTCIDPVTNLVEIIRVNNKSAAHVSQQFENSWLARYPKPVACIHDQGTEFTGYEFQMLLQRQGIKDRPTTVKNPQANAICE